MTSNQPLRAFDDAREGLDDAREYLRPCHLSEQQKLEATWLQESAEEEEEEEEALFNYLVLHLVLVFSLW